MSNKKLCALTGKREYTWLRAESPDDLQVAYQNVLPSIRSAARLKGYAIGVHGSMRRDLDLIAAPWKSRASSQKALVKAIQLAVSNCYEANPEMHKRPHGRNAYVIHIGTHAYIDLSVMPANRDKAHNG
jgi:hypothetical protein